MQPSYVLAIHGGAGTLSRSKMTSFLSSSYLAVLRSSLIAGESVLKNGGCALDAVRTSIKILEDSELFNAGKGATFSSSGDHELDAAIMDGESGRAGALAAVKRVKNPIEGAYAVMTTTKHVMMVGEGGEKAAEEGGCEMVENSYFSTEWRKKQLEEVKEAEQRENKRQDAFLDDNVNHKVEKNDNPETEKQEKDEKFRIPDANFDNNGNHKLEKNNDESIKQERNEKFGTVGAVALDLKGNLAAGTSTGGITNKREGRVGDSPIIGAGTYANNLTCAVSCTGHGEFFMRHVVAYDVSALMELGGLGLEEAGRKALERIGEKEIGGLIAVDRKGNVTLPFNTEGTYRGFAKEGEIFVAMY